MTVIADRLASGVIVATCAFVQFFAWLLILSVLAIGLVIDALQPHN